MQRLRPGADPDAAFQLGQLKVRYAGGKEERWPLKGGFFEVSNNRATVLADSVSA